MTHKIYREENGFASIIVGLMIMIVTAIITVGFVLVANQENSQTLNKQENAQAYYAAESGINTAYNNLSAYSTTCSNLSITNRATEQQAQVTCLMVNETPGTLVYDGVGNTTPVAVKWTAYKSGSAVPADDVVINWTSPSSPQPVDNRKAGNGPYFPSGSAWKGNINALEVSLTPLNPPSSPNNFTRSDLINNTFNVILYPTNPVGYIPQNPPGKVTFTSASTAQDLVFTQTKCSTSSTSYYVGCVAMIDLSAVGASSYLMVIKGIYNLPSNVTVSSAVGQQFSGAQALIDSTGEYQGVLRRIQVRLGLSATNSVPAAAIESGLGVCKHFTSSPSGSAIDPSGLSPGNISLCTVP